MKTFQFSLNYSFTANIFIFLILATLSISCKNDIKMVQSIPDLDSLPIQSAKQIEILYSDSAELKIRIKAAELNRFDEVQKKYIEFPKGIKAEFFDHKKLVQSTLSADYAIYTEKDDIWEARNNVVVTNRNGNIINTEKLFWNRRKQIIYSESFVKITTPDEILFGEGFEADQNLSTYVVKKLSGTVNVKDQP